MKIVKVEPVTPMLSLTWMIGSRCNYACSYCPPDLHDDTSPHPDLNRLKQAWDSFYSKTHNLKLPYKISFTGGEVTANKSFLPLIDQVPELALRTALPVVVNKAAETYGVDLEYSVSDAPPRPGERPPTQLGLGVAVGGALMAIILAAWKSLR